MSDGPKQRRQRKTAPLQNATVNDVASLAKTSTATVSRALNRPQLVDERVRKRVFAAIKKLGYVPNNSARALRQNQTRLIGLVLPTLNYALYATFYDALQRQLATAGFFALLTTSDYDLALEADQARRLVQQGAQGLVLVGKTHDRTLTAFLKRARVPYLNTYVYDPIDSRNTIGFDNVKAIAAAVEHLVSLGHRDLAMLSGITTNQNDRAKARVTGFLDAVRGFGLPDDQRVAEASYSIEGGRQALREIFNRSIQPTGIICGSDMLALGAIQECRARGLKVPHDISIMGFDDLDFAAHLDPPLTTVEVPSAGLGRVAADYIMALCTGTAPPTVTNLPTRLVIRNSTSKPRARASLPAV